MSDFKPSSCPNCGYDLSTISESEYCPRCGQKQYHSRFRVRLIIQEFFSVVLNLEKGLLFTLLKLFTHPGEVVTGYWDGLTKRYYNPIRYAFVMVTLSTLITLSSGAYDQQVTQMSSPDSQIAQMATPNEDLPDEIKQKQIEFNNKVQGATKKYLSVFSLALIPLGAFSIWIVYRKRILYGEALIATSYYIGHTSLISIPFALASLSGWMNTTASMITSVSIYMLFGVLVLKQTFDSSWGRAVFKALMSLLLAIVTFAIIILILSLVVGTLMMAN